MAVLCTLPAQKFLPVCKPHFIKSRFSLLVVFQILCFTKLRFLQLQKRFLQKFKSFWTLEASPPVPHGGRALLRESPELPEFQGFSRGGSEIEPHGVYILNSECTLFELRADSDHSSSFIIIIIHHASCVMCHASCVMTCWRPSMCFSHSNPKPHFRSEVTQPQPHSYGFLRRLYYSFFINF